MSTVDDVQAFLVAAGVIDGSTGWPSVRRYEHETDDGKLVVITEDGGRAPEFGASEGLGDSALADPAVQIRVRGPRRDGDAASAKAHEIAATLHGLRAVTMGSTEYWRVAAQSEPVFIGGDDKERPSFTQSFRCARLAEVASA